MYGVPYGTPYLMESLSAQGCLFERFKVAMGKIPAYSESQ
jgi:hypothetical protein